MKRILAILVIVTFLTGGIASAQNITVKSMPPSVIKTVPAAGDMAVDAASTTRIEVTFSKDMQDGSWSFVQISPDTFPAASNPRFTDKRTCVIDVNLEPAKTYVIWLNSQTMQNFKDTDGRLLVPYLLVFQTK